MSSTVSIVAYYAVMAVLSTSIFVLAVLLVFLCRKQFENSKSDVRPAPANNNKVHASASLYTLMEIDAITDGFDARRVIGRGRLGIVYYAALPGGGDPVAIKRIHPRIVLSTSHRAGFGFQASLRRLSMAHHPNVVRVLGFSEAPGERIIVTEMEMMSLDLHLDRHRRRDRATLDWGSRVRIAAGVARAIEYLHEVAAPPIVHGCLRPSNVLLDGKLRPKVSDYGLSFLAAPEGLEGYLDEEYWVGGGQVSKESDVYGFGVVLLELLSGGRICGDGGDEEDGGGDGKKKMDMVKWGMELIREMRLSEVLDPELVIPVSDLKGVVRLAKVATACVGNSRKNRPSIAHVASILNHLESELSS